MNLYLDDDSADRRLIALLTSANHSVITPVEANLTGARDARHLIHCCQNDHVLLSRNHDDFLDLHLVIEAAQGRHPGILIVRFDNDPTRDMTPRGIVAAVTRIESSAMSLANQFVILNHWR